MKFDRKTKPVGLCRHVNNRPAGTFLIDAYISECGIFCIHRQLLGDYRLSHLPTGYRIIDTEIKADAARLARKIGPMLNWKRTRSWASKDCNGVYKVDKNNKQVQDVIKVLQSYRDKMP